MRKLGYAMGGLLLGASPLPAMAQSQTAPAPAPTPTPAPARSAPPADAGASDDEDEIVVTGQTPRGSVVGDIKPEQTLNAGDVRSYGVSSIADLVNELAPFTSSGRGRSNDGPVILLNGKRIASFFEIRDIPAEAIERVDILPEEVSLKYGYRADQRVLNIVLRRRFRSLTLEATGGMPTRGGNSNQRGDVTITKIAGDNRLNIDAQVQTNSGIDESERHITSTRTSLYDPTGNVTGVNGNPIDPSFPAGTMVAGVPGTAAGGTATLADFAANAGRSNATSDAAYRSLVAPATQMSLNMSYARPLSAHAQLSVSGRIQQNESESKLGLPGIAVTVPAGSPYSPFGNDVLLYRTVGGDALKRDSNSQTAHVSATVNGDAGDWRWSVTGNYDRSTSETITDTGYDPGPLQALLTARTPGTNPFGPIPLSLLTVSPNDRANSTTSTGQVDAMVNGSPFRLPAGKVSTTLRASASQLDFDSSYVRSSIAGGSDVHRTTEDAQLNVDVPITSRRNGVLAAIGDLSINGNAEVQHLSDFGTLWVTGYGARWAPIPQAQLIASVTDEQGAPSPSQLGGPYLTTPNVRTFDYVRGETVDITTVSGGNPGLSADHRHVFKLGLNLRPFEKPDFNFTAEYVESSTRDPIASFPAASAAIERAFPDRFVREPTGSNGEIGRLLSIDTRPVNFRRAESSQLRWGFNMSFTIKSTLQKEIEAARARFVQAREEAEKNGTTPPDPRSFFQDLAKRSPFPIGPDGRPQVPNSIFGGPAFGAGGQGGRPGGGGPGAGGPRPGGPGGGFRGGGGGRGFGGANAPGTGRLQFALFHTWHFRDSVLIREGLPELDLLNGDAIGSSGGQPRHEIEAQGGYTRDGIGLRFNANWQSATRVNGGTTGSTTSLDFGSLATVGARVFIDFAQQPSLVRAHPWLLGTRAVLSVDNLFDARQRVTDQNGTVPLSYQPDLLNPTGRVVRLTIRKLFF